MPCCFGIAIKATQNTHSGEDLEWIGLLYTFSGGVNENNHYRNQHGVPQLKQLKKVLTYDPENPLLNLQSPKLK